MFTRFVKITLIDHGGDKEKEERIQEKTSKFEARVNLLLCPARIYLFLVFPDCIRTRVKVVSIILIT